MEACCLLFGSLTLSLYRWQFDAAVAEGSASAKKDFDAYEMELERAIREHVVEADRKIQRGIRVRLSACTHLIGEHDGGKEGLVSLDHLSSQMICVCSGWRAKAARAAERRWSAGQRPLWNPVGVEGVEAAATMGTRVSA